MYLVIDIGNTNQKAAIFDGDGQIVDVLQREYLKPEDLEALFNRYNIVAAIISSVAFEWHDLHAWLSMRIRTLRLSSQIALPIQIHYATPDTLGSDRIANAVGARRLFPNRNVLSIQAGTCLVTDVITFDGTFVGGTIAPGLRMRFCALQHFTAKLPLLEPQSVNFLVGDTTDRSILSGVINGMVSEIEGMISRYKTQYSDLQIVVTGGDVALFEDVLKNSIFAAPNLVLLGLYDILRFHVPE